MEGLQRNSADNSAAAARDVCFFLSITLSVRTGIFERADVCLRESIVLFRGVCGVNPNTMLRGRRLVAAHALCSVSFKRFFSPQYPLKKASEWAAIDRKIVHTPRAHRNFSSVDASLSATSAAGGPVENGGGRIIADESLRKNSGNSNAPQSTGSGSGGNSSKKSVVPGLAAASALAGTSFAIAELMGSAFFTSGANPVSAVPIAIVLGMTANHFLLHKSLPESSRADARKHAPSSGIDNASSWRNMEQLKPGLSFATTTVLRMGIICVGARLSAYDVISMGASGIPPVIACVGTGLVVIPWLSNRMCVEMKFGVPRSAFSLQRCRVTLLLTIALSQEFATATWLVDSCWNQHLRCDCNYGAVWCHWSQHKRNQLFNC